MVDLAALRQEFRAAVIDALTPIIPENENLVWNPETGQILAVTGTSWGGYDDLVGEEMELARKTWVTAVPELQSFCQAYTAADTPSTLRLE